MIILYVVVFTSCSIGGNMLEMLNNSSDEKTANSTLEQILDAIDDNDEEGIKDIFSQQALEEDKNFDTEMEYIFGLFDGEIISWEKYTGPIVDREINYGVKVKAVKSFYEVETSEESYLVFILEYTEDTNHPENVGVYALRIIKAEDKETQFASWQKMAIPGIYMPVERN